MTSKDDHFVLADEDKKQPESKILFQWLRDHSRYEIGTETQEKMYHSISLKSTKTTLSLIKSISTCSFQIVVYSLNVDLSTWS